MRAQLPLAAQVLAAHVRAGRSIHQALADAPGDLPGPISDELVRVSAACALGASAADALGGLGDTDEVRQIAAAVGIQSRFGGDLAALLDAIAESLHDREALARAARVATAQARTTGRMVSLMPAFGVMALRVVDPPGFELLVGTLVGLTTLVASAVLTVVGHVLMRRLAAVEP